MKHTQGKILSFQKMQTFRAHFFVDSATFIKKYSKRKLKIFQYFYMQTGVFEYVDSESEIHLLLRGIETRASLAPNTLVET